MILTSNSIEDAQLLTSSVTQPEVTIIVIHWLNMEDTLECLSSLKKLNYPRVKIILVNNGSPDFDITQIQQKFLDVVLIQSKENLGFTGGNNLGIIQALQQNSDLILLINNDAVAEPELINELLPALKDPQVGIVGPVITYFDNPDKVWFGAGIHSKFLGYSFRKRPLDWDYKHHKVDFVNGCALMVKREVFERIGLLWEDLYLYFEEADLCLRAAKANYKCVLVSKPLVRHKVSSSGGVKGTNFLNSSKAYYFGRNPFLLLRHNNNGLWTFSAFLSQFFVILPFYVLLSIKASNLKPMWHYLIGMRDGILGRTGKRH